MSIEVRPATVFADVKTMVGPKRPDANVCWCLSYRIPSKENLALHRHGAGRKVAALMKQGPPGVLAYDGDEVVGWAAVHPRADTSFATNRKIPHVDDLDVWSVWCIRVRPGHRGEGISHALSPARSSSPARAARPPIEGYPVDNKGEKVDLTMAYVGTRRLFEKAGFRKAADTESVLERLSARADAARPALSAALSGRPRRRGRLVLGDARAAMRRRMSSSSRSSVAGSRSVPADLGHLAVRRVGLAADPRAPEGEIEVVGLIAVVVGDPRDLVHPREPRRPDDDARLLEASRTAASAGSSPGSTMPVTGVSAPLSLRRPSSTSSSRHDDGRHADERQRAGADVAAQFEDEVGGRHPASLGRPSTRPRLGVRRPGASGASRVDSIRGIRLLRSPARAQRVLDARRGRAHRSADPGGGPAGDAGDRRHRPRQHVRGVRVLQDREGCRHQADHRHRGVRHPGHAPLRQGARALGDARAERRRRLGLGRVHAHDAARPRATRACTTSSGCRRWASHGGLLLQAAHGPRAAADLLEGPHRDDRLPGGEVQTRLRLGQYDAARAAAAEFQDIFGKENYFAEIMDHGLVDRAPRR